ncbi:tail fiber assembly protein [Aeromonas hydrophila]|uniref:tail fiber assembly protein n=1 Tax=Aeromonas hydrophila TaxID=644 RepID=UPI0005A98FC6|nr:tail fiber assembly protein [Aeromonas hydrophila]
MEQIEIISAAHPRHLANDAETITLDVLFAHLTEPVPFTARKDDTEPHGRELYSRAIFGEFGPIDVIPAAPPGETKQQAILAERLAQAASAMAPLLDAEALGIISEAERMQLTAWQYYRVALYRLPQSEGWPSEVIWPDVPSA